jgi:hypothetical protein
MRCERKFSILEWERRDGKSAYTVITSSAGIHTSGIFDDFKSFSLMIFNSIPDFNESIAPMALPNANLA